MAEPVAIVGLACRFPGADGLLQYWDLLAGGVDAVREVPRHRWDPGALYDPDPSKPGKTMSKWGGYLDHVDGFDWRAFRISPREAKFMDPQHRVLLEVAWEGFEDAGLRFEDVAGTSTSVFVGIMWNDYAKLASRDYTKLEGYNANGNSFAYSANRISYFFDLKGPSVGLDVQCASSLTAVHLACESIWSGNAELSVAAGVNLIISPDTNIAMSKASILSPDGKVKAWDAKADGFVRGEGAGVAILKPLSAAIADGDRVYAVIRSTVATHAGKTDWIMAPSRPGQEHLLQEAYRRAGIDPADVDYIELHGTGTKVGDPIEAAALAAVMCAGRAPDKPLRVGSAKTNIGHLDSASGMAGLLKAALAIHRREIPPSINFSEPNPAIPLDEWNLRVQTELGPWPETGRPPVAGVTGLSFGGGHAHVVLTGPPAEAERPPTTRPPVRPFALPLSGRNDSGVRELAAAFAERISGAADPEVFDICHTAAVRRTHHDVRAVVIGRTREELVAGLAALAAGEPRAGVHVGKRSADPVRPVFVLSGQGTPWWASGRELLALEPVFRREVAACDQRVRAHARWSLLDELTRPLEGSRLARTAVAQPATFALQMGLAALWRSWGVEPAAVIGHSIGEVAAAALAGAVTPADAARLAVHRGKLLSDAPTLPAMAAVLLARDEAEALCAEIGARLLVAAENGPAGTLVSGEPAALEKLVARCAANGVYATVLPEHDVFHRAPKAYGDALADWLGEWAASSPAVEVFATGPHDAPLFSAEYWGRQMAAPVEFRRAMDAALAGGHTTFLELAAHPVLAGPVGECARAAEVDALVVSSLKRGESEQFTMLDSAAQLFVRGHDLRWESVLAGPGRVTTLPTHPWQRERMWIDVGDPAAAPAAAGVQSGHPMLGTHVRIASSGEHVWESVLDSAVLRWLDDHLVQGVAVLAGAGHVEMVTAAVEEAFGWRSCVLRDVQLGKALVLPGGAPRRVQLVLTPTGADEWDFAVYSRSVDGPASEPWTGHVRGRVASHDGLDDVLDPGELRGPLHDEVPGATVYRRYAEQGEHYGPTSQGIATLWRRDGEVLAEMKAPPGIVSDLPTYRFHPALLDACMHAVVMAEPEQQGAAGFMPTSFDEIVSAGRLDTRGWSHVRLQRRDEGDDVGAAGALDADIAVLDRDGRVAMRIRGMHLQFLDESALRAPLSERWYFEMDWTPLPRGASPNGAGADLGRVAVIPDSTGVADVLAARLGDAAVVLNDPAQLAELPDIARIVHLGALDSPGVDALDLDDIERVQTSACGLVLEAVKSLGTRSVPITLVTRGAQRVLDGEGVDPLQAALWGFGRSIAQERPELWGGLVDLDAAAAPDDPGHVDAVLAHLAAGDGEDQVAIRAGEWRGARLRRTRVAGSPGWPWRTDCTYLVTGGLGDLGLAVARWLAEHGARRLILMGRTPLPPRRDWRTLDPESPAARRVEAVRAIEALGVSVHLAACDVGDEASMAAFLDEFAAEGWPPIKGVIHSAGVAPFEAVEQMTLDGLHDVLRSKAAGTIVLDRLLPDLDVFVLFSSASAVLSSPRLAHYAAGNAFEDAFAWHRHARGLPVLSVDWGPWGEVGMATRTGAGGPAALRGMYLIPLEDGFAAMERLLASGRPNVAVLPVEWDEWAASYRAAAAAPILSELTGAADADAGADRAAAAGSDGEAAPALVLLPREERAAAARERVFAQLVGVLRVSAEQLEGEQSLAELGFDSLMAMELRARLADATGVDLSILEILSAVTAEQLVAVLAARLDELGDTVMRAPDDAQPVRPLAVVASDVDWFVDQLTDEDVEALLVELEGAS